MKTDSWKLSLGDRIWMIEEHIRDRGSERAKLRRSRILDEIFFLAKFFIKMELAKKLSR